MFILITCVSMIFPLAGFCLAILYFNQYKRPFVSALLCGVAFSAGIYGYSADLGNDIYRHMQNAMLYSSVPFYEAFDLLKTRGGNISTVFTWDIWLWFISKFDIEYLLQSSGAFIGYTLISYMVFSVAKMEDLLMRRWLPFYGMAILSFPILEITIGIRSANAFIMCALAYYLYCFKHKNRFIVCLILGVSVFLHHGAIIPIVTWMFLPVFSKYKKLTTFFLVLFFMGLYKYKDYMILLMGDSSSTNGLISNSIYTASSYSQVSFSLSFHSIVTTFWRLFYSFLLIIITKKIFDTSQNFKQGPIKAKVLNFPIALLLLSFGLMFIFGNTGLRFIGIVTLLCSIIMESQRKNFRENNRNIVMFSKVLLIVGNLGCCALYLYDMGWGTGSLKSFILSIFTGYLSRSL